jgi:hypothetical protein
MLMCTLGFYSCSDDDDPKLQTEKSSIIGKWEVSNQNAEYGSFEFTGDNKYIITQKVSSPLRSTSENPVYIIVIFGDYSTIMTGEVDGVLSYGLDLKEFGMVDITINSSGTATITVNGETYSTEKAETVTETDKTKLLCHTWYEKDYEKEEYSITFTTAGTYIFYEADYNESTGKWDALEPLYGTWEWTSDGNIKMTDEFDDEGTNPVVKIVKLTSSEFVYIGDDGNGDDYTAYLYR